MSAPNSRIAVRLTDAMLEALETVREKKGLPNLSEAIRAALQDYIGVNLGEGPTKKALVIISARDLEDLEKLVETGHHIDVDDAIRTAVREYVAKAAVVT